MILEMLLDGEVFFARVGLAAGGAVRARSLGVAWSGGDFSMRRGGCVLLGVLGDDRSPPFEVDTLFTSSSSALNLRARVPTVLTLSRGSEGLLFLLAVTGDLMQRRSIFLAVASHLRCVFLGSLSEEWLVGRSGSAALSKFVCCVAALQLLNAPGEDSWLRCAVESQDPREPRPDERASASREREGGRVRYNHGLGFFFFWADVQIRNLRAS